MESKGNCCGRGKLDKLCKSVTLRMPVCLCPMMKPEIENESEGPEFVAAMAKGQTSAWLEWVPQAPEKHP